MDMKKILQAFDGAASKPKVEGANDMKRFVSIVQEGAKVDRMVQHVKASEKELGKSDKDAENIAWATANKRGMLDNKNKKTEAIVTGFEEGSLGGDANGFLLAADDINDLVMSNVDKIKINANEEKLKDMMAKFNAFMSAYHSVGKEILQPDMFGEDAEIDEAGYRSRDAYQRDYDSSQTGFGRREREDDEYHVPDPDPEFERNKQESTMYNITIDGKPVNPQPILGRSNAIAWAKEQVKVAGLDVSTAKISPVRYGESIEEARANTASVRAGLAKRNSKAPLSKEEQAAKDKAKSDKWLEKERAKQKSKTEGLSFKDYVALTEASKQIKGE